MQLHEARTINSPEARRAALQQRLDSFQQEAITVKNVVVGESEEASITYTRGLIPNQLPRRLKALLYVAGATSKDLKIEYGFRQTADSQSSGLAFISWNTNVGNDNKIYEDEEAAGPITARIRFESWRSDIKSMCVSLDGNDDRDVTFSTNDSGGSINFKGADRFLMYKHPELFARLTVAHDLLNTTDAKLQLKEAIVSLLDINAPLSNVSFFKKELDSHRNQREEQQRDEALRNRVRVLKSFADKILGEEQPIS